MYPYCPSGFRNIMTIDKWLICTILSLSKWFAETDKLAKSICLKIHFLIHWICPHTAVQLLCFGGKDVKPLCFKGEIYEAWQATKWCRKALTPESPLTYLSVIGCIVGNVPHFGKEEERQYRGWWGIYLVLP